MDPITAHRHGLHTVPVTERDRLAAAARAAGLRLASGDLDRLLPAWKRYIALVEELRAQVVPEPDA
jgi:hypothetical protein